MILREQPTQVRVKMQAKSIPQIQRRTSCVAPVPSAAAAVGAVPLWLLPGAAALLAAALISTAASATVCQIQPLEGAAAALAAAAGALVVATAAPASAAAATLVPEAASPAAPAASGPVVHVHARHGARQTAERRMAVPAAAARCSVLLPGPLGSLTTSRKLLASIAKVPAATVSESRRSEAVFDRR